MNNYNYNESRFERESRMSFKVGLVIKYIESENGID